MNLNLSTRLPLLWSCLIWGMTPLVSFSQASLESSTSPTVTISKEQALDFFLIEMAIQENLPIETLRAAFQDVKTQTTARQYMVPSGSASRKNWTAYSANVMSPIRIQAGKKFLAEHEVFLKDLEKRTGVPPSIVVGIIGVETVYGRNMGNFPVRDILVTFAFDYPPATNKTSRESMFKEQLQDHILNCIPNKESVDVQQLRRCLMQEGSFAGAIGMPQFMPSSIRRYAKDGDGNGTLDIRSSPKDAMESVASFLVGHGWQKGEPIRLPISSEMQSSSIVKELADGDPNPKLRLGTLKQKGVITSIPQPLNNDSPALIVDLPSINLDGSDSVRYLVGLKNFEVITQYNRSFFYANSITDFGEAVVSGEPITKPTTPGKHPSTNNGHRGHKR